MIRTQLRRGLKNSNTRQSNTLKKNSKRNYAADPLTNGEIKVRNPATGSVIDSITIDTIQNVEDKIELARQGKDALKEIGFQERMKIVERFNDLLVKNHEELSTLLTREVGKPITQARSEVKSTVGRIEYLMKNVGPVLEDIVVYEGNGMKEVIKHDPLGVVGNISAWNYPYFVGSNVYIPALLTGSSVVYKPSEHAVLTGLKMQELFYEAGLPKNAFQTVIGGAEAGKALVKSETIDGIFFTGSHKSGIEVAASAFGTRLVERIQLELGGKDPVYVHEDVDIEATAEAVMDGVFYNNGQSCCSIERVYIHEKIHDEFLEAMVAKTKEKKIGDPMDEQVYFGPLTRSAQLKVLLKQIEDAKSNGGIVVTGGKSIDSAEHVAYIEPTIISNANHQMLLMTEETFGPVVGVMKVSGPEEAYALMEDSEYGLTASVYSKDRQIADNLLTRLNVGTAYWNTCDRVSPRLPWSGRKGSGIGVTLSIEGLRTFVIPKAWHIRSPE